MGKVENFVKKILAGAGGGGLFPAWMKGFGEERNIHLRLSRFCKKKAGKEPGLWGIRK
jgi:hypothetical protein